MTEEQLRRFDDWYLSEGLAIASGAQIGASNLDPAAFYGRSQTEVFAASAYAAGLHDAREAQG